MIEGLLGVSSPFDIPRRAGSNKIFRCRNATHTNKRSEPPVIEAYESSNNYKLEFPTKILITSSNGIEFTMSDSGDKTAKSFNLLSDTLEPKYVLIPFKTF